MGTFLFMISLAVIYKAICATIYGDDASLVIEQQSDAAKAALILILIYCPGIQ